MACDIWAVSKLRILRRKKLGLRKSTATKQYRDKAGRRRFQGNRAALKATQVYPPKFGKAVTWHFSVWPFLFSKMKTICTAGCNFHVNEIPRSTWYSKIFTKVCRNHLLYADAPRCDSKLDDSMDPWDDAKPLGNSKRATS